MLIEISATLSSRQESASFFNAAEEFESAKYPDADFFHTGTTPPRARPIPLSQPHFMFSFASVM
jgi:hypothetical protein